MPGLMTDPTGLVTHLANRLNYSDYLTPANPIVDAARQRLQGTQQGLMQQNALVQQQMQQRRQQQMMIAQLRAAQAASQLPAGLRSPNSATPGGIAGPAPRGQVLNWINQALQATGHIHGAHDKLANGLYQMIMHESGGNPYAQNGWDSNAKAGTPSIGLMQTILPTFNSYAMKGYGGITNPVANIIAGLRYALSRYGMGMVEAGGRHDANGNYIGY